MSKNTRRKALCAAAALMLLTAGCGGDATTTEPGPSHTPSSPSSSAEPTLPIEALVREARVHGTKQAPIYWKLPDGLTAEERAVVTTVQRFEGLVEHIFDIAGGSRQRELLSYLDAVATGQAAQSIEDAVQAPRYYGPECWSAVEPGHEGRPQERKPRRGDRVPGSRMARPRTRASHHSAPHGRPRGHAHLRPFARDGFAGSAVAGNSRRTRPPAGERTGLGGRMCGLGNSYAARLRLSRVAAGPLAGHVGTSAGLPVMSQRTRARLNDLNQTGTCFRL